MRKNHIIGIDLGGTNLKIGLFDLRCRFQDKKILPTGNFIHKESLIDAITCSVQAIIKKNRIFETSILGVGLGLPGPIDAVGGMVHFFPNIPGWKDVRLRKILEYRTGLTVTIDNDANLMCLAEYRQGAAKGARNALCITLGTGVGGGLIIEGKLYRGSSFAAGEMGHLPINERGPACNCGGIACLESYIGNQKIMRAAKRVFGKDVPLEDLSRMAQKGNTKAIRIWQGVGKKLGLALVGAVNVLNPDRIVIGGGVANAGRVLFDTVEETILTYAMIVQAKAVRIVKAKLGADAGMIGAALLVKEHIRER